MHGKTLLFSAILAKISVSFAKGTGDNSVNDAARNPLTPAASVTNGLVHGPFPLQQVLAYPELRAGLAERALENDLVCLTADAESCDDVSAFANCLSTGETCIIDQSCTIQIVECPDEGDNPDEVDCPEEDSPHKDKGGRYHSKSDLLARASEDGVVFPAASNHSPKLELKDESARLVGVRRAKSIGEEVDAAMPDSVQKAMLNSDPEVVAQSLAKEFSGDSFPQWYEGMPASVKTYYATITLPPMMHALATNEPAVTANKHLHVRRSDPVVDGWVSSVQSYESLISSLSSAARSRSEMASALSRTASSNSRRATSLRDASAATTASLQSLLASSQSQLASSESQAARSASSAVYNAQDNSSKPSDAGPARFRSLVLYSSMCGAVACFLLALIL